MQPSGMRYSGAPAGGKIRASRIIGAGELDYGRGVSPNYVEEVIKAGVKTTKIVDGRERTIYSAGTIKVVTEQNGDLVITILTE